MKKSHVLTVAGASTILAAITGHAQCTNGLSRFYVDADMGAAFQQDAAIKNSPFGNSGEVQFDPGLRANIRLGYNLSRSFAAEFETGVVWNSINNFSTPNGDNKANTLGYSADLYEIPLLANVIYRPLHGAFQPYIGAGCGGVAGMFTSQHIPLFASGFSDTDWTFAYQAEAGLRYVVSKSVQLGIAYQFLGTTEHDWTDSGDTLKTDGTMTHAVVASFIWEF